MDESHKTDLPGKAAQASKAPAEAVMQAGSAAPEKPKPWKSQGAEGPAAAKGATGAPSAGKPDSGASHGSGGASHSPSQPASSSPKAASQGPAAQPERPQTTPPSQASAQPKDTSRPAPDFAQPQAGGGDGSASRRFAFFNRTKAGEGDAAVPARKKFKLPRVPVSFNAPVVLGFVAASLIALLLGLVTGGAANTVLFSTYRTAAFDPLAFVRMFTLGHHLADAVVPLPAVLVVVDDGERPVIVAPGDGDGMARHALPQRVNGKGEGLPAVLGQQDAVEPAHELG